jgi:hypothetical protein
LGVVEMVAVIGLLTVAILWAVTSLGGSARQSLTTTGQDIGSPASLVGQFKPKGNNGVGNGIDGAPPGNAPENDGAGTGPGNPGAKGGTNGKGSGS